MEVNADLMSAAGVLFPWDTNMYGSLMASFCWLRFWKNNSSRGRSSVLWLGEEKTKTKVKTKQTRLNFEVEKMDTQTESSAKRHLAAVKGTVEPPSSIPRRQRVWRCESGPRGCG